MLRVDMGEYEAGVAQYERALAADPKLAVVHYLVADAMLKQPAADAARINESLRRAIELDPAFTPAPQACHCVQPAKQVRRGRGRT